MEDICLWLLNFAGSVPQVLQIILISDGLLKKAPVPIEGEERQEFSSKKNVVDGGLVLAYSRF